MVELNIPKLILCIIAVIMVVMAVNSGSILLGVVAVILGTLEFKVEKRY